MIELKKIAIVTRCMVAGGIEKSILSMIESIDKNEYEITLLLMEYRGEFLNKVPKYVKVESLYGDDISILNIIKNDVCGLRLIKALKDMYYGFMCKVSKNSFKKYNYHSKILGVREEVYDLAIADHVPASFPVIYVINNIKARKKAAWIHSDISLYKANIKPYKKYYEKFDKIFSVSKETCKKMKLEIPNIQDKIEVFYNIINQKEILELATHGECFDDDFNGIRILTVGRLCEQKGQDLIVDVIKRLSKKGYNFRWYCVGDGELRSKLEKRILSENIKDKLILLGNKNNPYKYIKECDIYVQPSRHECYCTTVTEAKCFFKPMVITDVNGSKEQIVNRKNGLIVNANINDIYSGVSELIENSCLKEKFINELKSYSVDTRDEIYKLYKLITE